MSARARPEPSLLAPGANLASGIDASNQCIDEEVALAFASGSLSREMLDRVDAHVDTCEECRELIATALSSQRVPRHARPANFNVSDVVADRYEVVRFIGRGGMGEVYEARDTLLSENVALKSLSFELVGSSKAIAYLKSEVQLARRVSHPNVCRVFDVGVHVAENAVRELHFLTMELCAGETLGQRARRGPLALADVRVISRQLLAGLAAAHRAGILHRDFKSDNVILREGAAHDAEPSVVITDFGLARAFAAGQEHVATSQLLVGSAAYMAPEQVEGGPLGEAVDIYSFGVVLFEMLTGTLPFQGQSPMGTALQRLRKPAPRPSQLVPTIPRLWDDFVARCLAREPGRRFPSVEAANAALATLDALKGPAPPQRRHLAAIGSALSLSLAVMLGIIGFARWKHDTAEHPKAQAPVTTTAAARPALALPVPSAALPEPGAARPSDPSTAKGSDRPAVQRRASSAKTAVRPNPSSRPPASAVVAPAASAPASRGRNPDDEWVNPFE